MLIYKVLFNDLVRNLVDSDLKLLGHQPSVRPLHDKNHK